MVFSTFVKHAKAHSAASKPQFFESSYPYLRNYNALVNFEAFFQKTAFGNGGPHPSNTSDQFFGIDHGHYGLYYTMFNNDGDKRKKYPINYEHRDESQQHSGQKHDDLLTSDQWETFFILKVARETFDNVKSLHLISKKFLSPTQLPVKPFQVICPRRYFSAQANPQRSEQKPVIVEPAVETETEPVVVVDSFVSDLLNSQASQILALYQANQLNSIFPIYQSLKRNDISLPSVELYNIVLQSINDRPCDNMATSISQIESKLTNLLTVYQDLITLSSLKPTMETYNIVLDGLFSGCKESINIVSDPLTPQHVSSEALMRSKEFLKIATDLFQCIQHPNQAFQDSTMVNMVSCLCIHPDLITFDLFEKIRSNAVHHPIYYISLISSIPFLNQSKEDAYKMIEEEFTNYKTSFEQAKHGADLPAAAEFPVYSSVVQSLIKTGNLPHATKFVDDILNDYKHLVIKEDFSAQEDLNTFTKKYDISLLVSTYIKTLSEVDLPKSLEVLQMFNKVPFVPEFSIEVYNSLINKLILEFRQTSDSATYSLIWKLHSYIAIRKDYHTSEVINDYEFPLRSLDIPNAREGLLSVSIDIGDHERVFLIIKELLLKNHMIKDFNIFRKLLSYLHNGSYYEPHKINKYYFELMWNIIESQSSHYSNQLNYYLSGVVQFITTKVANDNTSIKMLLNSPFIKNTFMKFRLESDNIYGVMNVTRDIMLTNLDDDVAQLYRSIQLQSYILNELEETESYYLELSEEILQFKKSLREIFASLVLQNYQRIGFGNDIIETCKSINFEIPEALNTMEVFSTESMVNLSFQLNVNYSTGLDKFIDSFKQGFTFNYDTWKIILNSQFATEVLQCNEKIKIETLIDRIYQLSLDKQQLNELLIQLISLNNERVNIQFLKMMIEGERIADDPLIKLFQFWKLTENVYFRNLIQENFEETLLQGCKNKNRVIDEYLKGLTAHNEFQTVVDFFKERSLTLNTEKSIDLSIIESVLNSFIELHDLKSFDKVFRQYFSASKQTSSQVVMSLLIKYCTYKGLYNIVLNKFASKFTKASETRELIYFNQFMKSLNEETTIKSVGGGLSIKELTYQIISSKKLSEMKELYSSNLNFIKYNKDEIISEAIGAFVSSSTILEGKSSPAVYTRFQTFLSFLKSAKLDTLSTSHLISVIKFYSIIGREDLVNVLLNKIAYPTESGEYNISPMLDYYFFEIPIYNSTRVELAKVFQEFYRVFDNIKDVANTKIIDDLCLQYKLSLNEEPLAD